MGAGRPIEYNDTFTKKAEDYLLTCGDFYDVIQVPKIENGRHTGSEDKKVLKIKLPSKEGLALYLGISRDTIYEWCQIYPEFSDIVEKIFAKQGETLINKGLTGEYNSKIVVPMLTKHDYRTGYEQTGKDGKPLVPPATASTDDIAEIAKRVGEELKAKKMKPNEL